MISEHILKGLVCNMKGVIDRMEDGFAIILIEERNNELIVRETELPDGSKEGTWLTIDYSDGSYTIHSIDENKTQKMEQTSTLLMKKLQSRKKTSKFKRK